MTTNEELALDSVRHDETIADALPAETKAGAPRERIRVAAGSRTIDDVVAAIEDGNREIKALGRQRASLPPRVTAIHEDPEERRHRLLETLRGVAERKGRTANDPVDRATMRNLNDQIDTDNDALKRRNAELERRNRELEIKSARRPGPTSAQTQVGELEAIKALHRAAVVHHLMTGETQYKGHSLSDLQRRAIRFQEQKAGTSINAGDGGVLLMPEQDMGPIEKMLRAAVPMRRYATVKTINAYTYKKPLRAKTGGARWGNELSSGGETNTPSYVLLDVPAHDLYAEPAVAQNLLEDSPYAIEQEIADGCLDDFAYTESTAFVAGNGVEKPCGFLGYDSASYVADSTGYDGSKNWTHGKLGYAITGVSGAFATPSSTVSAGDAVIALGYLLLSTYRQNAKWMMGRTTIGECRKLKDGQGRWVWTEAGAIPGQPAQLDGREVIENDFMPDIAANSFSIALADWERFYLIVDRVGLNVLRDPYTKSPYVVFKTRKRVGGAVQNFNAGKFLKFGTS